MEQVATVLEHIAASAAPSDRFADLVERQSRFVFRVAFSLLRNVEDSEDVAQETFLKLHRSGQWKSMDDERAFLARVAWRIALDRIRKRRHDGAVPEIASKENLERSVIDANWNATVHRLIGALPDELRQPLALSTVEEMTSQQIAEVMGIPEGTVRSRLSRARQLLKEKLSVLRGRAV